MSHRESYLSIHGLSIEATERTLPLFQCAFVSYRKIRGGSVTFAKAREIFDLVQSYLPRSSKMRWLRSVRFGYGVICRTRGKAAAIVPLGKHTRMIWIPRKLLNSIVSLPCGGGKDS